MAREEHDLDASFSFATGRPVPYQVRASYSSENYPAMDSVAHAAAGRDSEWGEIGATGRRDLGWIAPTEIDAQRMAKALQRAGLSVEVRRYAVVE